MKLLVSLCVVALLATGVALGAIKERAPDKQVITAKEFARAKKDVGNTGAAPLPKLVLPNVQALAKRAWKSDLGVLSAQQKKSAQVLVFFNGKGKWMRATRHEKCWEVPWQRTCTLARATHRLHTELLRVSTRRLLYEIPDADGNWTRAMRYAQRPFPGTYDWLEFISNRECRACYTPSAVFTCNYQGSGACGPMQFMAGTFYGHADDAAAWMKRNGFIVPEGTWEWQNPLGQALTAAFMRYTNIDGCHWCL